MQLASDVDNPQFVGATSPDANLYVKFEMHTPEDPNKSAEAGRKVFATRYEKVMKDGKETWKDTGEPLRVPYVTIMKPGDSTSIIHTPAREDHKRRFPNHWLSFQIEEGLIDGGENMPGWKLEEWTEVNQDLESLRNLKYMRFYTVEQVAGASDAQVQRMGIGGMGLRELAKQALREKLGLDVRKEIAAKDAEIAEMRERQTKLEAQVAALMNQAPVAPQPPQDNAHVARGATPFPEKTKRKYTKRSKPEATA